MEEIQQDQPIIVVGAGAAGLMAALELQQRQKNVLLLEAAGRTGGRIFTIREPGGPVMEAGAEFIHGDLPLTIGLLHKYGIPYIPTGGKMVYMEHGEKKPFGASHSAWSGMLGKMKDLTEDLTLDQFLRVHYGDERHEDLRIQAFRFAEGFDLADPQLASTKALYDEWAADDHSQYRVMDGYQALTHAMAAEFTSRGGRIECSQVVRKIEWQKGRVRVRTESGREWTGTSILVTVPLGILHASAAGDKGILFEPALPQQLLASTRIGYGTVIKLVFEFSKPFWAKESGNMGFLYTPEVVPTWWTQYPEDKGLLTGWLGGPRARDLAGKTDAMLVTAGLISLASAFRKDFYELESLLQKGLIFNWANEPFVQGGYSFETLGTRNARDQLSMPVDQTIYFGGEGIHLGESQGTVEAALASGQLAAQLMLGQSR